MAKEAASSFSPLFSSAASPSSRACYILRSRRIVFPPLDIFSTHTIAYAGLPPPPPPPPTPSKHFSLVVMGDIFLGAIMLFNYKVSSSGNVVCVRIILVIFTPTNIFIFLYLVSLLCVGYKKSSVSSGIRSYH